MLSFFFLPSGQLDSGKRGQISAEISRSRCRAGFWGIFLPFPSRRQRFLNDMYLLPPSGGAVRGVFSFRAEKCVEACAGTKPLPPLLSLPRVFLVTSSCGRHAFPWRRTFYSFSPFPPGDRMRARRLSFSPTSSFVLPWGFDLEPPYQHPFPEKDKSSLLAGKHPFIFFPFRGSPPLHSPLFLQCKEWKIASASDKK